MPIENEARNSAGAHPPLNAGLLLTCFASGSLATLLTLKLAHQPLSAGWFTTLTALLVILALSSLLLLLLRRSRQLEQLASEHTDALARKQELLRTLMDSVPDYIYFKDAHSRFTRINQSLADHLGLEKPDQAVGRTDKDFFAPAFAQAKILEEQQLLTTGAPILDYAEKFETDREKRWILTNKVPVRDPDGKIIGLVGISRDISELKFMEDVLRKFSQAIEQSPVSVVITNDQGLIEYVNPKFCELTGYDPSEVIGQNPRILKSGQTPPAEYCALWQTITAGREWVGDFLNKKKNGELFWERAHLSCLKDTSGKITHYLGIKENITDRKLAEKALQEANQLLQAATERANEMADHANAANAAKSEFLANMSHEIRTPLNGVLGMLELLLDAGLSDEQARYAQIAQNSSQSLLEVINDILDFSKIEARKLTLETLDFSLPDLLDNLLDALTLRTQEKGIVLGCVVAPEIPPGLQGDVGRLRQILINLAGNAVKFTSQGEIVIRVTQLAETAAGVKLHFSVRDTGIGIPADKTEKLFAKFSQLDSSTTRLYGGTGLGLAISKQLVELMGGEIGVRSEPGKGSEFWFTVQLTRSPAPAPTLVPPPLADLRGMRVLIVDEHPVNREMFSVLTSARQMRPAETADGPSALVALSQAQAAQDPVPIALIDMQMLGMDGLTLAKTIKKDPRLKTTHLIMSVPFGQTGAYQKTSKNLFAAVIEKPVQQRKLHEILSLVIKGATTKVFTPPSLVSVARQNLYRGTILVVEDNLINQEVTVAILNKLGLSADVVSNGREALKALEVSRYELVLMDTHMPEMDGPQAAQIIRQPTSKVLNHAVPIIAMTASAMSSDRDKCLRAGMNDFLTKPVEVESLSASLEKWLNASHATPPPVSPIDPPQAAVPPAAPPNPPIFNRAALLERLMNDEGMVREIVKAFAQVLPGNVEQLKNFVADGNAREVQLQAHKIRGAALNLGGEALASLLLTMEDAARDKDFHVITLRAAELDTQLIALMTAIKNEVPAVAA